MLSIRTVLHLTDSSKRASFGMSLACSLASDHNARLVVANLAQPATMVAYEFPEATVPGGGRLRDELWDELGGPSDRRPKTHTVRHITGAEDLTTQILHLIQKLGCDLVIIGMEDASQEARVRYLTDQLLRRAHCPVLIAKCPVKERVVAKRPDVLELAKSV